MNEEAKATEEKVAETQEQTEAKHDEEAKSFDEVADALLDEHEGKEKPGDSSSESKDKPGEKETEKKADADEDPDLAKKEAEAAKETEIPEEFHKHEAWIRMKEKADKAISDAEESAKKLEELQKGSVLSDEDKALLENVKQFTSSKQFAEDKLRQDGVTDEAIIKQKLAEAGFDVASDESSIEIAAKALNLDMGTLSDTDKNDISNLVKISDALLEARLGKILPALMNPISEQVAGLTSKESGLKLHDDFEAKVKNDGVLDFGKDIEPDIAKWLDDNDAKPDDQKGTQKDLAKFMQDAYHEKLVLHKKAVEKKGERDEKLSGNKPGGEGAKTQTGLPDKTGNFEKDADALFDHLGIH